MAAQRRLRVIALAKWIISFMWIKFKIVSARTVESKKKHVLYSVKLFKDGPIPDTQAVIIERRYTDFLELYNSLRQGFPELTTKILFPKKVLLGNFSSDVIETRLVGLENFLKIISENLLLLDSTGFKKFLIGNEERLAKKFLQAKKFVQAKPLLEKNFKILNKILTEHNSAVIMALCLLAACCSADPQLFEDGAKYGELALRRFDSISDIDLLHHYVPLLQMCKHLWTVLGKDKEMLETELSSLKRLGHRVDESPSLLESVLSVE